MYLLADFSNKENKAKRRAAELDMAVRLGGAKGGDKANLKKVRARRNQTFVDPLAYRSTLKKDKVFQPYALDTSKSSTIPKWADKSRGISERMKIGGILGNDFISTRPSESEKVIEKVRKIDADRFTKKLNAMPKSDIAPVVKPKGDKRFLIGAGLGLAGLTGLALANRKKKERQDG